MHVYEIFVYIKLKSALVIPYMREKALKFFFTEYKKREQILKNKFCFQV